MKRKEVDNASHNDSKRLKSAEQINEIDYNAILGTSAPNRMSYNSDHMQDSSIDDNLVKYFPGRRSFGGFNKVVERQFQQYLDDLKYRGKERERATDTTNVDDEEMIKRYSNLIGLPRGPNQGRKQNKNTSKPR